MQTYEISLDMHKAAGRIERTVVVRRGDDDTQQVRASITAGGQPYTPKGTARLDIMHADGTWARCSASASGSTATCTLPSAALNGAGRCRAAHFVFTDGTKVESTEGFALVIQQNVDTDGTPGAQSYDDALNALNDRLQKAEAKRAEAEQGRVTAEQGRTQAEKARAAAEGQRAAKEAERVSAEQARASAESARADAETKRAQAEQSRASEESKRATAETERKKAEEARKSAEAKRAEAERARAAAQAKNDADQALNNEAMKKLSPVILQEGQYDRATLRPTVEGEPNRMYFVPMVAPAAIELYDLTAKQVEAGNLYVEWMWVGGKWEQMGQSEMTARPISTEQVDAVFAGRHPVGEDVLNLTGLDYFKGRADTAYATAGHKHGTGDITSGTLSADRIPALPMSKVDGLRGELDGKQPKGEYAPRAHRHAQGDVNGLSEALAGKAASTHSHRQSDVDGLTDELGALKNSVSVAILYEDGHWCVWRSGGVFGVNVTGVSTGGGSWDTVKCPYVLPERYRPKTGRFAAAVTENGASWTGSLKVSGATGEITIGNNGGAGSTSGRHASITWLPGH